MFDPVFDLLKTEILVKPSLKEIDFLTPERDTLFRNFKPTDFHEFLYLIVNKSTEEAKAVLNKLRTKGLFDRPDSPKHPGQTSPFYPREGVENAIHFAIKRSDPNDKDTDKFRQLIKNLLEIGKAFGLDLYKSGPDSIRYLINEIDLFQDGKKYPEPESKYEVEARQIALEAPAVATSATSSSSASASASYSSSAAASVTSVRRSSEALSYDAPAAARGDGSPNQSRPQTPRRVSEAEKMAEEARRDRQAEEVKMAEEARLAHEAEMCIREQLDIEPSTRPQAQPEAVLPQPPVVLPQLPVALPPAPSHANSLVLEALKAEMLNCKSLLDVNYLTPDRIKAFREFSSSQFHEFLYVLIMVADRLNNVASMEEARGVLDLLRKFGLFQSNDLRIPLRSRFYYPDHYPDHSCENAYHLAIRRRDLADKDLVKFKKTIQNISMLDGEFNIYINQLGHDAGCKREDIPELEKRPLQLAIDYRDDTALEALLQDKRCRIEEDVAATVNGSGALSSENSYGIFTCPVTKHPLISLHDKNYEVKNRITFLEYVLRRGTPSSLQILLKERTILCNDPLDVLKEFLTTGENEYVTPQELLSMVNMILDQVLSNSFFHIKAKPAVVDAPSAQKEDTILDIVFKGFESGIPLRYSYVSNTVASPSNHPALTVLITSNLSKIWPQICEMVKEVVKKEIIQIGNGNRGRELATQLRSLIFGTSKEAKQYSDDVIFRFYEERSQTLLPAYTASIAGSASATSSAASAAVYAPGGDCDVVCPPSPVYAKAPKRAATPPVADESVHYAREEAPVVQVWSGKVCAP